MQGPRRDAAACSVDGGGLGRVCDSIVTQTSDDLARRRKDSADEVQDRRVGRIDEMTSRHKHLLREGKRLGQAIVHTAQDVRRILRGDEQGRLAYPGQFLAAEVEGILTEVQAMAPDLRQDRGAGCGEHLPELLRKRIPRLVPQRFTEYRLRGRR